MSVASAIARVVKKAFVFSSPSCFAPFPRLPERNIHADKL